MIPWNLKGRFWQGQNTIQSFCYQMFAREGNILPRTSHPGLFSSSTLPQRCNPLAGFDTQQDQTSLCMLPATYECLWPQVKWQSTQEVNTIKKKKYWEKEKKQSCIGKTDRFLTSWSLIHRSAISQLKNISFCSSDTSTCSWEPSIRNKTSTG